MSEWQLMPEKLGRLRSGEPARVLDLFSGCGGLSLGFRAAGFEIAAAVESDAAAARSHGMNFHPGLEQHAVARDILGTSPQDLATGLQLGAVESCTDVIVGGPPCQAFARVGRSKLRQVHAHPEAFRHDPRAMLYVEYLRYVERFRPLALLMENVPDIMNYGGVNIAEEIALELETMGYIVRYTLLNAVHYGVPQLRERMFLVAYHEELELDVTFPAPTHAFDLPRGYTGSRQVALRWLRSERDDLSPGQLSRYVAALPPSPGSPPGVTAGTALGDLPAITGHLDGTIRRGPRRLDHLVRYSDLPAPGSYARWLEELLRFDNPDQGVPDHVIRYLPRDYKLFRMMDEGDEYPAIHARAIEMRDREIRAEQRRTGKNVRKGSTRWKEINDHWVPPYDPGKFSNKWWKLYCDRPARTLMAHLAKDGYSHIHYDRDQCRTISVREAARLQGFPDGFRFSGTMNPAFRQIGNAVPPPMARALAIEIKETLDGRGRRGPTEPDTSTGEHDG